MDARDPFSVVRMAPTAALLDPDDATWVLRGADLLERIETLAAQLAQHGVGHGDAVALLLEHEPAAVLAFLAVVRCNACAIPLNPQLHAHEMGTLLATRKPVLMVLGEDGNPAGQELAAQIEIPLAILGSGPAARLDGGASRTPEPLPGAGLGRDRVAFAHERNDREAKVGPAPATEPGVVGARCRGGLSARRRRRFVLPYAAVPRSRAGRVGAGHVRRRGDRCRPSPRAPARCLGARRASSGDMVLGGPNDSRQAAGPRGDQAEPLALRAVVLIGARSLALDDARGTVRGACRRGVRHDGGLTSSRRQSATPGERRPGCVGMPVRTEVRCLDAAWEALRGERAGGGRGAKTGVMDGYLDNDAANAKSFREGWFRTSGDVGHGFKEAAAHSKISSEGDDQPQW